MDILTDQSILSRAVSSVMNRVDVWCGVIVRVRELVKNETKTKIEYKIRDNCILACHSSYCILLLPVEESSSNSKSDWRMCCLIFCDLTMESDNLTLVSNSSINYHPKVWIQNKWIAEKQPQVILIEPSYKYHAKFTLSFDLFMAVYVNIDTLLFAVYDDIVLLLYVLIFDSIDRMVKFPVKPRGWTIFVSLLSSWSFAKSYLIHSLWL